MSGAIEKFDALHQLQSKSRLRIDLGLRFGSTDHRSRKHNGSCIGSSFCQAQLGRILTRFDGRQPLLARDWRVQLRRLRSSRIPARLKNLNWSESVTISAESVQRATKLRERIQRVLWIVSNLPYFVAVIPIAFFWTIVWWKKRRLRRNP